MSMITDVWHELVRRRLWPLAVLLLAALVAVPFLLATDPAPVPVPATAALPQTGTKTAADEAVTGTPVVALADDGAAPRRRVLGARKDPFQPAPTPKPKVAKKSVATTDTPGAGSPGGGTPAGGGSTPSAGAPAPAPSTPAAPAPAKKTFPANSLTVRYGSDDQLKKSTLERLQPLLDGESPILVYLGLRKGGREAVFLVDASVRAQGDGRCESGASDCETLVLREGETEFLDVIDEEGEVTASYELDVLAIHPGKASAAESAKADTARKRAAALGRRTVDGHIAGNGPLRYRYDAKTGTVKRLADDAYAAAVQAAAADPAGVAHVIAGL
jgi:hypothetical protein